MTSQEGSNIRSGEVGWTNLVNFLHHDEDSVVGVSIGIEGFQLGGLHFGPL